MIHVNSLFFFSNGELEIAKVLIRRGRSLKAHENVLGGKGVNLSAHTLWISTLLVT